MIQKLLKRKNEQMNKFNIVKLRSRSGPGPGPVQVQSQSQSQSQSKGNKDLDQEQRLNSQDDPRMTPGWP